VAFVNAVCIVVTVVCAATLRAQHRSRTVETYLITFMSSSARVAGEAARGESGAFVGSAGSADAAGPNSVPLSIVRRYSERI
jgi:hypothetical protein